MQQSILKHNNTCFVQGQVGSVPVFASRKLCVSCRLLLAPQRSVTVGQKGQKCKRLAHRAVLVRATSGLLESQAKLLNKTEISTMIPRQDLLDQLRKWAISEIGNDGYKLFGMHCDVDEHFAEDESLLGFTVWMQQKGERVCGILVRFDDESLQKFEWIGRGEDGFPTKEGPSKPVEGKHLEIWKVDNNPVDSEIRSAVKLFCQMLLTAMNRYYAFGSVFVEEG
eukprot:TRINITY_DN7446_c0_g2_i1.p2 TRINITY_DN7446_c0_g2~~TRINITY_DN7446_c0_g2_i1.p2  ORF type:complete len:224 (+),score=27.60 TRINITY_DN7446_c0_g2_i1:129-800(+)